MTGADLYIGLYKLMLYKWTRLYTCEFATSTPSGVSYESHCFYFSGGEFYVLDLQRAGNEFCRYICMYYKYDQSIKIVKTCHSTLSILSVLFNFVKF